MGSDFFGLFIGLAVIFVIIATLIFGVIYIFKRNKKNLKRTGFSFLLTLSIAITLILILTLSFVITLMLIYV